jgi:excisionase family DNA binding protein
MEQLLTVAQAAERIGVSGRRVRQFVADGTLREAGRAGTAILLHRSEVERLAKEGWPGRRPRRRTVPESTSD